MHPLEMVRLTALMQRIREKAETAIEVIASLISMKHLDLARNNMREISGPLRGPCVQTSSAFSQHRTSVAAILPARRGSLAPAICRDCTLLVCAIFIETMAREHTDADRDAQEFYCGEKIYYVSIHVLNVYYSCTTLI
jgi:hypothetical protein